MISETYSYSSWHTADVENDERILNELRDGNAEAADRLLVVFGDRVYGLCLRILGSQQDAEEAVQETFLTVWTKWQTFQGKSKFSSWIYRIAANHAYMKLRKRRKHQGNVSLDVDLTGSDTWIGRNISVAWANDAASPSHEVELKEKRALLERAIQELKPGYRTAYILRDIEGMCLEEIAEIMNLSEPAVKSRVHRARLKLRKILAPLLYGTTVKHLGDING